MPLFLSPGSAVQTVGAVLGCVLATSASVAETASTVITQYYTPIADEKAPIVNLQQAIDQKAFYPMEVWIVYMGKCIYLFIYLSTTPIYFSNIFIYLSTIAGD